MCVCACVKHEKCHDNSPEATKNFKILTQKLVAVEALAKAAWNLRSWPIRFRSDPLGIFLGRTDNKKSSQSRVEFDNQTIQKTYV